MATFIYTWNATFLALPADIEDESLGAQRIRDTKGAVGERFVIDHALAGDANDGKHTWVTLRNQGNQSPAALDAGDGRLFASSVAGNTELFYQDAVSRVTQVTTGGTLNTPSFFPITTTLFFGQAAPPAGWTINPLANDVLLRVNSTVGGAQGGSWVLSGLTVAGHTLATSEMPAHTHPEVVGTGSGAGPGLAWAVTGPGSGLAVLSIDTQATGGGAAHDHGAVVSDGTWRPAYLDVIVAEKTS